MPLLYLDYPQVMLETVVGVALRNTRIAFAKSLLGNPDPCVRNSLPKRQTSHVRVYCGGARGANWILKPNINFIIEEVVGVSSKT